MDIKGHFLGVELNGNEIDVEVAKNRFNRLHTTIYGVISDMLRKAKIAPMGDLVGHNPSYTKMVEELKDLKSVLEALSGWLKSVDINIDFEMIDEYIALAENLAIAIEDECHDSLGAAVAALDDKPYV